MERRSFLSSMAAVLSPQAILGRLRSNTSNQHMTDITTINKAVLSPPTDAGAEVIGRIEQIQPQLGYRSPVLGLPDRDKRHDPYKARNLAQEARGTWANDIRHEFGADVSLAHVVSFLGGTGDIALTATGLPEVITGRPVFKTAISSHEMRGVPGPAEARNTTVSYELMQYKWRQAGYGHVLLSNMFETFGLSRYLNKVALFQGLLPQFDTSDFEGRFLTGACAEIEAGAAVDELREDMEDNCFKLFRNPWFVPSDFNWVSPPDESPLGSPAASRAFALLPERFDGMFTDVNPDGAPEIEPFSQPIDNAYLLVLRPISDEFVSDMFTDTKEWLMNEIADAGSEVGSEVRRVVRLNKRLGEVTPTQAQESFNGLLSDLKNIE